MRRDDAHATPFLLAPTPTPMISLYTFSRAAFAAIERQVNEFANMVINFVELILMSLFW